MELVSQSGTSWGYFDCSNYTHLYTAASQMTITLHLVFPSDFTTIHSSSFLHSASAQSWQGVAGAYCNSQGSSAPANTDL